MVARNGDGGLRYLYSVIVGRVNRMLLRLVDPVLLMYLPITCGDVVHAVAADLIYVL